MLCLTCRPGDRVHIGSCVDVKLLAVAHGRALLGVLAPREVRVQRDDPPAPGEEPEAFDPDFGPATPAGTPFALSNANSNSRRQEKNPNSNSNTGGS